MRIDDANEDEDEDEDKGDGNGEQYLPHGASVLEGAGGHPVLVGLGPDANGIVVRSRGEEREGGMPTDGPG